LPAHLPGEGWLRAAASSVASQQVGGDYYDLVEATPDCWSAVVADVSGKGVSSALLAGVLQGALMITGAVQGGELNRGVARLNRFLFERTGGEKYATIFYCQVERGRAGSHRHAGRADRRRGIRSGRYPPHPRR
jgi:serine phosphatase RsbU (regulator of sigma subunit)